MRSALQEFTADYLAAVEEGAAPDYGQPIGIQAVAGSYGTAILVEFADGRYLSPYFSQHDSEGDCWGNSGGDCQAPGDCEYGWCGSDRFEVQSDAAEWLDSMSTCGLAGDWDWVVSSPDVI